jgi:hypothetical protein
MKKKMIVEDKHAKPGKKKGKEKKKTAPLPPSGKRGRA